MLIGTISASDIRGGLLDRFDLNSPTTRLIHRKELVAPPKISSDTVRQVILANETQQSSVINMGHHVIGLHLWNEISFPTD